MLFCKLSHLGEKTADIHALQLHNGYYHSIIEHLTARMFFKRLSGTGFTARSRHRAINSYLHNEDFIISYM
jgi:hypothetical protein